MQLHMATRERKHDRTRNRLTDAAIQEALARGTGVYEPGHAREGQVRPYVMLPDGGGLFLRVGSTGSASWLFKYMLEGTARELGLGPHRPGESDSVSLTRARELAGEIRAKVKLEKQHPRPTRIETKARDDAELAAERARMELETARKMPFRVCAERCITARNMAPRNTQEWRSTLSMYAYPIFRRPGGEPGDMPASEIDSALVQRVLEPVWLTHKTMPAKLRMRIEAVLEWAKVMGYRGGDNPAEWKGRLRHVLAKRSHKVERHAAMPFDLLAEFMGELREYDDPDAVMVTRAKALELVILSALRTSDVREAKWSEFDLKAGVWSIPRDRMKVKNHNRGPHRVPISGRMLEILTEMRGQHAELVFPSTKPGKPLAGDALRVLLQDKLGYSEVTVHGFRTTFKEWIAKHRRGDESLGEFQMDHDERNEVERAYDRDDRLELRRELMEAWAKACGGSKW